MSSKIAIIGSGPTGIYTLKGLIGEHAPLEITIFEREDMPGKGMPYQPHINDRAMLSNIASIEIPPICESLTAWLRRQNDATLQEFGIARDAIAERTFYTRVVLGEYLQAQFYGLVQQGRENGHRIAVKAAHRVSDIALTRDDIELTVETPAGDYEKAVFDHVVLATGHDWPEATETRPGYFVSPWPAPALKSIPPSKVGILGTSLSGIDALITVATAHGGFLLDDQGDLQYHPHTDTKDFNATMMSRKGILPEADFYCEIPYRPLVFCTEEAIERLIATHEHGLLDAIFALFRQELALADPDYAARIGLSMLSVETLASAYFNERQSADPFVFAARNLAEAEMNQKRRHTVEWRYAILRMHEVIARAIPHLDAADLERFHKHFKTVFVDDYATVPHDSIRRLLALYRAGKLSVKAIGDDAEIDNESVQRGAVVRFAGQELRFDAFIDATGQSSLSARDLPFPTLLGQGVVSPASTRGSLMADGMVRTGGVDLDAAFRPIFTENLSRNLYCGSISFLLHKLPFVQGITSARDIGDVISAAILESEGELTAA
ncbi:FAD/NAD(P)-binding protein [Martelella mediterranea]|uniref:FAD-dependent urate hydroxylase HpyO/Asp monooxygenase CreE-like FAD/NAD(P)-binding domain-containing protein n=1 Tax=Martelella mediterranea DSM 17316 TaxID=1122214 RepID=A0A1U9Z5L8_9HYPH|nr:FAD/NAD(P)-binding protein [Martelella mediterranea]AQZ52910.1 hypothetical protein Mame_03605 [Martelella mediterranea DSM 17316]